MKNILIITISLAISAMLLQANQEVITQSTQDISTEEVQETAAKVAQKVADIEQGDKNITEEVTSENK